MKTLLGKAVLVTLTLAVLLSAVACSGGQAQPTATPPKPSTGTAATPAPAAAAKATQAPTAPAQPQTQAKDAQSRISESANLLLLSDKAVLKSYHIEASGTEPRWDQQTKKAAADTYSVKADVSGQDLYLVYTSQSGDKPATTTEGYMINGGIGGQNGKDYVMTDGKPKESFGAISMAWALFPLRVVMPLAFAAMGPTAQGSEAIDGRQADKFAVDTANAPTGAMGVLGGLMTITSAKGTVWVDKQTGALLKCVLDYEQNFVDPPGSTTVAGSGKGHVELLVTKVGNVTVKLPQ